MTLSPLPLRADDAPAPIADRLIVLLPGEAIRFQAGETKIFIVPLGRDFTIDLYQLQTHLAAQQAELSDFTGAKARVREVAGSMARPKSRVLIELTLASGAADYSVSYLKPFVDGEFQRYNLARAKNDTIDLPALEGAASLAAWESMLEAQTKRALSILRTPK